MTEIEWMIDRVKLYELRRTHPGKTVKELVAELKRSTSWVRKWSKRQKEAEPDDPGMFQSRSRERQTRNVQVVAEVEKAILEIRDEPPEGLGRRPGPVTILYYLNKRSDLKTGGYYLPRSTSTIWDILNRNQRIMRRQKREHQPEPLEEPMSHWQID